MKKLMNQERGVKKEWLNGNCKDTKLDKVRSEISDRIAKKHRKRNGKGNRKNGFIEMPSSRSFQDQKKYSKSIKY